MRKTILLMISAAAIGLASCNGSENTSNANQASAAAEASATSAVQPQQQGTSPMQPTGDIDKDAKDLFEQMKALEGDQSKINDIEAMKNLYGEYYKKQGKQDEFIQKLTQATEESLNADKQQQAK